MTDNKIPNFDKVLIDADILHYKCAAAGDVVTYQLVYENGDVLEEFDSAEDCKTFLTMMEGVADCVERKKIITVRDIEHCKKAFASQVKRITRECNANNYQLYLGGDSKKNFRHEVATIKVYKSGRNQEKPTHFEELKKWIIATYKPIISHRIESDDRLCVDARKDFEQSKKKLDKHSCKIVVATIDKDALGVPGWLYNPDKMVEPEWISVKDARRNFWGQALEGDTIDVIQGCPGIGPAKTTKLFENCGTDEDYWTVVCKAYLKAYKKKVDGLGYVEYPHAYTGETIKKTPIEIAIEMCTLLHMLRRKGEVWQPPEIDTDEIINEYQKTLGRSSLDLGERESVLKLVERAA